MRVMVIKDKTFPQNIVDSILIEESYTIDYTDNMEEGVYFAEQVEYDLILIICCYSIKEIVDICRSIRFKKIWTPILIITKYCSIQDRIELLNAGADSIFVFPFVREELKARISNLLHRMRMPEDILEAGNLVMNIKSMNVYKGQKQIELTKKEYSILEYLMYNHDIVLTRKMIQSHVWGIDYDSESNLIDVYIRRIRRKINKDRKYNLIQTIHGLGYQLKTH